MNSELFDRLTALIAEPLDLVQFISIGTSLHDPPNTVDVSCHPGTPLVFTFSGTHVVFYCKPGATVGIDIPTSGIDPATYLAAPFPTDNDDSVVRMPVFPFLDGPHGNSFHTDGFIDSLTLIHRSRNDEFDGIAAVVFEFHDSAMFALSAAHESHFCYAFNNYCRQLLTESATSPNHKLRTLRRTGGVTPKPVDSVLWMVD